MKKETQVKIIGIIVELNVTRVISVHSKQKQKEVIKKATKSGKLFEIELY